MVACIKGIRSEDTINVLEELPLASRNQVKEITLDMAKNMVLYFSGKLILAIRNFVLVSKTQSQETLSSGSFLFKI